MDIPSQPPAAAYRAEALRLQVETNSSEGLRAWSRAFDDARDAFRFDECQLLLAAIRAPELDLSMDAQALILQCHGSMLLRQGDVDRARVCYGRSLAEYRASGNQHAVAEALSDLSTAYILMDRWDDARAVLEEALPIASGLGDRAEAAILSNLSQVQFNAGDTRGALSLTEAAARLYQTMGNWHRWGQTEINRALYQIELGALNEAATALRNALRALRNVDDPWDRPRILRGFGVIHRKRGRLRAAEIAYRQSIDIARHNHDAEAIRDGLNGFGHLAHECGDFEAARDAYVEAIAFSIDLSQPDQEAQARVNLALMLTELDRDSEAEAELLLVVEMASANNRPYYSAIALMHLGNLHRAAGRDIRAEASLDKALFHAKSLDNKMLVARVSNSKASMLASQARWDEAINLQCQATVAFQEFGDAAGEVRSLFKEALFLMNCGQLEEALFKGEVASHKAVGFGLRRLDAYCQSLISDCLFKLARPLWWLPGVKSVAIATAIGNDRFANDVMEELRVRMNAEVSDSPGDGFAEQFKTATDRLGLSQEHRDKILGIISRGYD